MSYKKSLLERKESFLEDACATCGGGGDEGGGGGEYEPGADDELALGKALKKLKGKKKREKPVSDSVIPEAVLPLDLKRDKEDEERFKQQDDRMKYGKSGKESSLMPGEVRKPKKGGGYTSNKKKVLEMALKVRKELM